MSEPLSNGRNVAGSFASRTRPSADMSLESSRKDTLLNRLRGAYSVKLGKPSLMKRYINTHTLTVDNGSENQEWRETETATGARIYFAHPYHSWERGTNENTNGLVRWYFPKGTDFSLVSDAEIAEVEYALNTRPRKRLRYRTPLEVFNKSVALAS